MGGRKAVAALGVGIFCLRSLLFVRRFVFVGGLFASLV